MTRPRERPKWSQGLWLGISQRILRRMRTAKVYIQTCNHESDHLTCGPMMQTLAHLVYSDRHFRAQWERYYAPTIYDNDGLHRGRIPTEACMPSMVSSGQQKWFGDVSQDDEWTPAVDANYAYVYSSDCLLAISRSTGVLAFQIDDTEYNYGDCQTVALGTHGDAFAIMGGRLICFDLKGKKIKWQSARWFAYGGQATVANGVVYAIDAGELDAIDEISGTLLWSWAAPSGDSDRNDSGDQEARTSGHCGCNLRRESEQPCRCLELSARRGFGARRPCAIHR